MLHIIPDDIFFYIIKFLYGQDKTQSLKIYFNLSLICKEIPVMYIKWENIYKNLLEKYNYKLIDIVLSSYYSNNYEIMLKKIINIINVKNCKNKFICPEDSSDNTFYVYNNPKCINIRKFGSINAQYNNCMVNLLLTNDCQLILKCFNTRKCKITQKIVDIYDWRELVL